MQRCTYSKVIGNLSFGLAVCYILSGVSSHLRARERIQQKHPLFFCLTLLWQQLQHHHLRFWRQSMSAEEQGKRQKNREGECQFLSLGSLTVITVEVAQGSGQVRLLAPSHLPDSNPNTEHGMQKSLKRHVMSSKNLLGRYSTWYPSSIPFFSFLTRLCRCKVVLLYKRTTYFSLGSPQGGVNQRINSACVNAFVTIWWFARMMIQVRHVHVTQQQQSNASGRMPYCLCQKGARLG